MNLKAKIGVIVALGAAVFVTVVLKNQPIIPPADTVPSESARADSEGIPLPRLLDLGADKCIPCKMMAPILEELRKEQAGQFEVEFADVWKHPEAGKQYAVEMIPTQIFFNATGEEVFRHVGFLGKEDILAKWRELGVDCASGTGERLVRETPVSLDTRPRDQVCSLCGRDVDPASKTLVQGETAQRILCSPHCYFIYSTSLVGMDATVEDAKVSVTDGATGNRIRATTATYLYGMNATGRPTIRAFATPESAGQEGRTTPGALIGWDVLRSKELAARCGFCDRAVYPEDACKVTEDGNRHTYGCCTHCAMGVAARTGKDIEVEAYDGLTGEPIHIRTLNGMIASIDPPGSVAWFGQKKNGEGQWVSAGCFNQGFFRTRENLRAWLEARPAMTGREITIGRALADKMKLTPEQIAGACKLGACP